MKITKEELKQIIEEVLKEADDTINPIGKGGSSWWEKTGRMRPHYTSHGADYERFEPTYKMTSDHPDHPDYKKPPSKNTLMRASCRRHAERSVYDYRFDGRMDRKTGDPANVEAVYTRCVELEAFTPGRKKVSEYLDDIFKNEPWYKDDRERRDQYWDTYYKLKPSKRKYMAEGEAKLSIATLKEFVKNTISETMDSGFLPEPKAENIYSKQANMPLEDEADDIIADAGTEDIMSLLDGLPPDEKLEIINMLMGDLYQANPELADEFDRMKGPS